MKCAKCQRELTRPAVVVDTPAGVMAWGSGCARKVWAAGRKKAKAGPRPRADRTTVDWVDAAA